MKQSPSNNKSDLEGTQIKLTWVLIAKGCVAIVVLLLAAFAGNVVIVRFEDAYKQEGVARDIENKQEQVVEPDEIFSGMVYERHGPWRIGKELLITGTNVTRRNKQDVLELDFQLADGEAHRIYLVPHQEYLVESKDHKFIIIATRLKEDPGGWFGRDDSAEITVRWLRKR